jgi:hypothetical protein
VWCWQVSRYAPCFADSHIFPLVFCLILGFHDWRIRIGVDRAYSYDRAPFELLSRRWWYVDDIAFVRCALLSRRVGLESGSVK